MSSVRPARRVGVGPVDFDGRKAPTLAQNPDIVAAEATAARADEAFAVQRCGNLLVHFAGSIEFAYAPLQGFEVVVVVVDVDAATHGMFAHCPSLPSDSDRDLASRPLLVERDLADDEA